MKKIQATLLQAICQNIPDAICMIDTNWDILAWNKGAEDIFGYAEDEVVGRNISLLIPEEIAQREIEHCVRELHSKGKMTEYETVRIRKDRRIIPIELTAVLLAIDREVVGYAAIMRDISERKQTEETLKLTQFSVDHASVSALLVGRDARLLYVNEQACRILGYTREEMLSLAVYDLDPHFPRSVWDDHWAQLKKEGSLHFETEHRRKDGTLVPIQISVNYVSFGGREYNWAFALDISGRKQAERELAKISRRNELILESAGDGIFGMNAQGDHIFLNRAGRTMLGYEAGELMSRHSHDIWHHSRSDGTPYPEKDCWIYMTTKDGIPRQVTDEVFWKKDGTALPVEYTTTPIYEESASVGAVVTFRDITERRRSQEALQRAYAELEVKVAERTRELATANEELRMEVTERRRAVELLRRSKELTDALNDLDTLIHSTLDLDEIMQRVVTEAAKSAKVDASMVGVFENDVFQVRYIYNMPEAFTRRELTQKELRAIQHVARARDVLAFNDAFNDARLNREFVQAVGIRSLLVAPLFRKNTVAGALSFYALDHPIVFETEHLDFARKLAASVSLALENAGLYRELRASERKLNAILNTIPDMAWMKDKEGRFILVNEAFAASNGRSPGELIGKTDLDIWPRDLARKYMVDDRDVMRSRERKQVEEQLAAADGTLGWMETIKTPVRSETGAVIGTVGIARDITKRRKLEEEIRHMAQHDALTGLPNRRLFLDILKVEFAQARRHKSKCAILFLDLDRFKEVNDTLGHDMGDLLLKQVAQRIRAAVREADTVARIGGDEFNVVLSDITRADDVGDIALKIVKSFREPFVLAPHYLHVTSSVGISIYPDDSKETDTLLRYADIAMYDAKENGRNTFRFYNPSINIRSVERMKLESWLRQAVKRGELCVLYQPQVDIRSMKMRFAEALVRWNHPGRGLLEPGDFIPLAEETGFITEIDEWVLRAVCAQARAWKDAGLEAMCLTVNLSARQFQRPELVSLIAGILAGTGMPPGCLDIEITESLAMRNVEQSARQLRELRDMGIHITVDDFGTGYSSLNYLKKLPIERIKIDRSFIRDITTDPDDRTIITAVTSMAHQMGIRTVAEGVETEEQLSFLRDTGCDEAQGFLFSRPVTARKFMELVLHR